MRDFKTYRYIVSNPKLDFKQHFQSWKDIHETTGITRSSLNLILGGRTIPKFADYTVERCSIPKPDSDR